MCSSTCDPALRKRRLSPYTTCSVPHRTITGTLFTSQINFAISNCAADHPTGHEDLVNVRANCDVTMPRCHMNCDLILLCRRCRILRYDPFPTRVSALQRSKWLSNWMIQPRYRHFETCEHVLITYVVTLHRRTFHLCKFPR